MNSGAGCDLSRPARIATFILSNDDERDVGDGVKRGVGDGVSRGVEVGVNRGVGVGVSWGVGDGAKRGVGNGVDFGVVNRTVRFRSFLDVLVSLSSAVNYSS